ncbi:hypothetical protein GGX14DRAFT_388537 [Mycena pura]|uniref:SET domain-containing protein n=1 Tax=Mycena pura TaxID=153505 RepID=A0AAD6VSA4_9AGAR|nr:hypothetical protein GGX14DRAFT_388537 [Mycena pura]
MKRGFLNVSKAKARPLGPALGTVRLRSWAARLSGGLAAATAVNPSPVIAPGTKVEKLPIGKRNVEVPEGYSQPMRYVERDARAGSVPNAMTFTTLPVGAREDEPVTECFFYPGSKEVVMNLPGFPKPLVHPATPAFHLSSTPGKGLGLFSTRALKQGDHILSERPLLVTVRCVPVSYPPSFTRDQYYQHTLNEFEKCLEIPVKRMRPEDREAFMALENSHKEDGSGPIVGIVRTNGLCLKGLLPDVKDENSEFQYAAICKDISRLNHSCSPNTMPRFDMLSFSYNLFAVRDIAKGEELTFLYTNITCSAAKRNEALKPYDFVCTCSACKDPAASDAARTKIGEFGAPPVYMWLFNHELPDDWILTECRERLASIVHEGLEAISEYPRTLTSAMEACIALGDALGASEWAAKLMKAKWDDSKERKALEAKLELEALLDPASLAYPAHPMWRKRVDSPYKDARTSPLKMIKMMQEVEALANRDGVARPFVMMF